MRILLVFRRSWGRDHTNLVEYTAYSLCKRWLYHSTRAPLLWTIMSKGLDLPPKEEE